MYKLPECKFLLMLLCLNVLRAESCVLSLAFAGAANTDQWRHVVYCCYQPKDTATEDDLKRKKEAWDNYLVCCGMLLPFVAIQVVGNLQTTLGLPGTQYLAHACIAVCTSIPFRSTL